MLCIPGSSGSAEGLDSDPGRPPAVPPAATTDAAILCERGIGGIPPADGKFAAEVVSACRLGL